MRPGSAAARAGLRAGMWLTSVDDVAVGTDENVAKLVERVHGCTSGPSCGSSSPKGKGRAAAAAMISNKVAPKKSPVSLRISWLRPTLTGASGSGTPATAPSSTAAAAREQPVSAPSDEDYAICVTCCCCCNIAGQLWQRVFRTPRWQCVALASALWLLFLVFLASDTLQRFGGGDFRVILRVSRSVNLTDGVNDREEASLLMSATIVPFYALLTVAIRRVYLRFRRDEPERWRRVVGEMDGTPLCVWHSLTCCYLAAHMLATYTPSSRWNAFSLLPTDGDEEAPRTQPQQPTQPQDVEMASDMGS